MHATNFRGARCVPSLWSLVGLSVGVVVRKYLRSQRTRRSYERESCCITSLLVRFGEVQYPGCFATSWVHPGRGSQRHKGCNKVARAPEKLKGGRAKVPSHLRGG